MLYELKEHIIFELKGNIPSKKNSYGMTRGRMFQRKSKEIEGLIWQLKSQKAKYPKLPLKNDCRLILSVWGDNRNDLDNQVNTIFDILQKAGVVENDRQIKQIEAYKIIKKPHRAEVIIWEMKVWKTN